MTDITACPQSQDSTGGTALSTEIEACVPSSGAGSGGSNNIEACEDEGCEGEQEPISISLSGGVAIETGDFVVVSGGTLPYSLSIDCGTVDSVTGEIDLGELGCCGVGAITVRDACGAVEDITVAYPGGAFLTPFVNRIDNGRATDAAVGDYPDNCVISSSTSCNGEGNVEVTINRGTYEEWERSDFPYHSVVTNIWCKPPKPPILLDFEACLPKFIDGDKEVFPNQVFYGHLPWRCL